jgi:hypothetical protein
MTSDEYTHCIWCDAIIIDYVPEMCCSGIECGCLGLPIDPPVCSIECEQKLMDQV